MRADDIRKKFLAFFRERGHAIVSSSSLIPDDPSVLLTTAGMQQFKKYYTGEADAMKDFGMLSAASVQKSFRTSDIDEVGDETHLTFFEMLGNFSFGGYFKKEAITYAHDFIVKEMGLEISYVTVFEGKDDIGVPKDEDSIKIWKQLDSNIKVIEQGMEDVFWGPTGTEGPCGPTTEIYCKNAARQDVEIWNIVFNEFFCSGSREQLLAGDVTFTPLEKKGIDTGMGLERLAMISQNKKNIFETDLFGPLLGIFPNEIPNRNKRVIVDHLRGAVFLIADGLWPSNKERAYIPRRLMRRAFLNGNLYKISSNIFDTVVSNIIEEYGQFYKELIRERENILKEFIKERQSSLNALENGAREEEKFIDKKGHSVFERKGINRDFLIQGSSDTAATFSFEAYQDFGFPFEATMDLLSEKGIQIHDLQGTMRIFDAKRDEHLRISAIGQEKKFGGHGLLLDTGELKAADEKELNIVTRLHTATHLLQAALRNVLGPEVTQQGSDITAQRTRFDFSFPRKLTPEEIKHVEDTVNEAIARDYTVEFEEMPYEEAMKSGALHFFREKYPPQVKVYSVYDQKTSEVFSREFCGGPHVTHTGEIGRFRIVKEEASSAGVRRIRGVVE